MLLNPDSEIFGHYLFYESYGGVRRGPRDSCRNVVGLLRWPGCSTAFGGVLRSMNVSSLNCYEVLAYLMPAQRDITFEHCSLLSTLF